MREGAFLGSMFANSMKGVETAREREQNARKNALTVVTWRVYACGMRAITARKTRLSVEDGIAGRQRLERIILAIALLIILVLHVSTTYRSEEVRNAKTKSYQRRAAKAVSGAVEDGWHKE